MAFKFSLQTEPSVEGVDTILDDMAELTEIKGEIEALVGQLPELDAVYENLTSSIELLNNAKDKDEVVLTLNVDGSLEALLGVAEEKITAKAALEGLGDKLKEWWKKFVDWIKKIIQMIKDFWRRKTDKRFKDLNRFKDLKKQLESAGETGFNVKGHFHSLGYGVRFEDFTKMLDSYGDIATVLQPILTKIKADASKVDSLVTSDKFNDWNDEITKQIEDACRGRLKDVLAKFGHFITIDEDGIVKLKRASIVDVSDIINVPWVQTRFASTDDVSEYGLRPFKTYHDEKDTLESLGWTYKNTVTAVNDAIRVYDKYGALDEFQMKSDEEVSQKYLSALNKIGTEDAEKLRIIKKNFNGILSFYKVGMNIQDVGFYILLKWVVEAAHRR